MIQKNYECLTLVEKFNKFGYWVDRYVLAYATKGELIKAFDPFAKDHVELSKDGTYNFLCF